jgi:HEAT repeat protein
MSLDTILIYGATTAALLWATLSAYVLYVSRRREEARSTVARVLAILHSDDSRALTTAERLDRVRPLLADVSRDMVVYTAADPLTSLDAFGVLAASLLDRWPVETLLADAASHRREKDVWRRTAALRILSKLDHPRSLELLGAALEDHNADVAGVAMALLGASDDAAAIELLVQALRAQRHPPSRIATYLENSPQRPLEAYRGLIRDAESVVRMWGATLLGQFIDCPWLERDLVTLIDDADPRVRKAAVASLGKVGDSIAADAALRLIHDPVPFVRAHAARALGDLGRSEHASEVARLLGDADWWVRAAAKHALESMGAEVWPVLVRCLSHSDGFVRNGAAEVFQNLGILDSLIVMEAASDDPSAAKVDLLRRIAAAGGTRLTDSLVERAGPTTGPRVRKLLATMGLEHVGAA